MISLPIIAGSDASDERLRLHPNETTVFVGDSVIFYCSKEIDAPTPVDWYHIPAGKRNKIHIYKSAIKEFYITEAGVNYQTYLSVDYNVSTGTYNLLISKVLVEYAGTYLCVDTEVDQATQKTELIVIDRPPVCQHNISGDGAMGENSCNLPLDYIGFNCDVSYHGNVAPMLKVYSGDSDSASKTVMVDKIRYHNQQNFVVNASSDLNGKRFHCQILHALESSHHNSTSHYECSSTAVEIINALNSSESKEVVTHREGSSSCLNNTNSSLCEYKWKNRDESRETVIHSRDLLHNESALPGSFRCIAKCHFNGNYCELEGQLVEFVPGKELHDWKTTAIVFIVLFVVMLFILSVLIWGLCTQRKRKMKNRLRGQLESESLLGNSPSESIIPNPPKGPLYVLVMNDASVELSWNPPAKDEGMQLLGYLIGKQIFKGGDWVTYLIPSDVVKFKLSQLQGGTTYNFRVSAKYDIGISTPLEPPGPTLIVCRLLPLGQIEREERNSGNVNGIAWLTNTVYVLCYEPAKIFAYSGEQPFARIEAKDIIIDEVKYPYDMTSIENPESLIIISDYSDGGQCLLKISVEGRSLTSWPVDDGRPTRLSSTSNNKLLVIVEQVLVENTRRYYLDIYDSINGERLKRIPLENIATEPLNPVETSEGNLIIMYSMRNQNCNTIIEMTVDGDTVRKVCTWFPFFNSQFLTECLAIREDNKIFVTSHYGCGVWLCDLSCAWPGIALTRDDKIDGPTRLCYLPKKRQLIVGQLRKPIVLIFTENNM